MEDYHSLAESGGVGLLHRNDPVLRECAVDHRIAQYVTHGGRRFPRSQTDHLTEDLFNIRLWIPESAERAAIPIGFSCLPKQLEEIRRNRVLGKDTRPGLHLVANHSDA